MITKLLAALAACSKHHSASMIYVFINIFKIYLHFRKPNRDSLWKNKYSSILIQTWKWFKSNSTLDMNPALVSGQHFFWACKWCHTRFWTRAISWSFAPLSVWQTHTFPFHWPFSPTGTSTGDWRHAIETFTHARNINPRTRREDPVTQVRRHSVMQPFGQRVNRPKPAWDTAPVVMATSPGQ